MRILIASTLYPIPTNVARGTFVADHVDALKKSGHEVRVLNPLPRMLRYYETGRSTLTGVAKAPTSYEHGEDKIFSPRYWAFPESPYPEFTISSIKRRRKGIEEWLADWRPEVIISHTLWPSAFLATHLAKRWNVPCVGVVHGYDFDVALSHKNTKKSLQQILKKIDHLVLVSNRLKDIAISNNFAEENCSVIPCHVSVENEWLKDIKNWRGRWRKDKLEILFPGDARRPEKNHYLALKTGEELERRGWVVGITTLNQQPRSIVWDRMLVASVTLITSKRESGPLVARESIACGTPVVAVDVGDLSEWLPSKFISQEYDELQLADAVENAIAADWKKDKIELPERFSIKHCQDSWDSLLNRLVKQ
ncbi:MAG: glycosyltransferase family 4 protein [Euryarchaeota archaeon]